jgi:hypothetical protein
MTELAILAVIWALTFVPPALAVWRVVHLSRRVFRGAVFPRGLSVGAGLLLGFGGYALLVLASLCFWVLVAVMGFSALSAPPDGPSELVPIMFAEAAFLLVWLVSEPLIYIGCRAKRANVLPAA